MSDKDIYCGIDAGASATKVVLLDGECKILSSAVKRSGIDFNQTARDCFNEVMAGAGVSEGDVKRIITSGYGRGNMDFCHDTKTEIACHGRAAHYYRPGEIVVVDIGGQDSKIIHIDAGGRRIDFKMNRKCAAGTGAFLEEISLQLAVPLDKMNALALASKNKVTLGSFCTIFTKTKILTLVRHDIDLEDIVRAVYDSVAKRVIEMDPLEGDVVMTGGVIAHNSVVGDLLAEKIGKKVYIPPQAQLAGAFGAALLAMGD